MAEKYQKDPSLFLMSCSATSMAVTTPVSTTYEISEPSEHLARGFKMYLDHLISSTIYQKPILQKTSGSFTTSAEPSPIAAVSATAAYVYP